MEFRRETKNNSATFCGGGGHEIIQNMGNSCLCITSVDEFSYNEIGSVYSAGYKIHMWW